MITTNLWPLLPIQQVPTHMLYLEGNNVTRGAAYVTSKQRICDIVENLDKGRICDMVENLDKGRICDMVENLDKGRICDMVENL